MGHGWSGGVVGAGQYWPNSHWDIRLQQISIVLDYKIVVCCVGAGNELKSDRTDVMQN